MTTTETETTTEDAQNQAQDATEPRNDTGTSLEDSNAGEERSEPQDELSKLRREAAGHRVSAREAREELEATTGRLNNAQDALLAAELKARRVQVTPEALKAVGLRDGVFDAETGALDSQALSAALATAEDTFGLRLRYRPAPDPTAGRETPPGGDRQPGGWSNVINPR
ncbi:hypothetical protein RF638_04370 [Kocuria sp. CPCC 205235]|uniref:hypothetical protein n=1 Tax=Kocuria sp. CPCC 205235 TaxID=3073549 RepID=UPI0034D626BC